jgi:hypothetical protein
MPRESGMHLYNICKAAATILLTQMYGWLLCRSRRFLRTVHPAGLGHGGEASKLKYDLGDPRVFLPIKSSNS